MSNPRHDQDGQAALFDQERREQIRDQAADAGLRQLTRQWITGSARHRYSYNFNWLGRPIIQYPPDIIALQEIVWAVRPDVIIETGIAHGGSLVLSASLLELLGGDGIVVGVDIDIRPHNRTAIEAHPLARRIRMIEGSSVDDNVVARVREYTRSRRCPLVILDSNHTHAHVRRELEVYSPLVRKGSYIVVFDTLIEDMPEDAFSDRPWGRGNNPKTAVLEFLRDNQRFEIDVELESKLLISVAPSGYLRCVKE
jgi:cephalosporin hydroxylase